jgi:queuine tRNA-ribosyltransferase
MSISFQIDSRSGRARTGRLLTPHGVVQTPIFMPVGTVGLGEGLPQDTLEDLGAQIILGNTYHLYLRPGRRNGAESWAGCMGLWRGGGRF